MAIPTLLDNLNALTPSQFENVVYDLVTAVGLRNAVWRTPGSDGGRDIEGEMPTVDFSGFYTVAKWYVECKRYNSSVDWPTVWEKISYADSHEADFLLIVTTASLSPQCKTEISRWNSRRRKPAVRFWEGSNLTQMLDHYPAILIKHGIIADSRLLPASFLSLAQQTSKVIQAAYGISDKDGRDNSALEAAAALAELLTAKIKEAEDIDKTAVPRYVPAVDGFRWLAIQGDMSILSGFDRHGLRALLAVLRHVTGAEKAIATIIASTVRVTLPAGKTPNNAATTFLMEVAFWGNIEARIEGQDFILSQRT